MSSGRQRAILHKLGDQLVQGFLGGVIFRLAIHEPQAITGRSGRQHPRVDLGEIVIVVLIAVLGQADVRQADARPAAALNVKPSITDGRLDGGADPPA
jgi:hypothetical protein